MEKITNKETAMRIKTGSGFHGYCPDGVTYARLVALFGEPTFTAEDSGDGKVRVEWVLRDSRGRIATIYDWKDDRPIETLTGDDWHIGSHGPVPELLTILR